MVFDLRLHDVVFTVAGKLFSANCSAWAPGVTAATAAEYIELNEMCVHGFRLVRQMCKGNAALGLAVARQYSTAMLDQCHLLSRVPGVDWAIPEALEAMYCENERKFVSGVSRVTHPRTGLLQEIDEPLVDKFAMLVNEGISVNFVREFVTLLSSLCTCHGQPMAEVQALLRKKLLEATKTSIVFDTFVEPRTRHIMVFAPTDADGSLARKLEAFLQWPRVAMPLHEFLKASQANDHYFATVVHFMATLCIDRETDAQELLRDSRYAPLSEVLGSLSDPALTTRCKAAYCRLLLHVYVDSEPLHDRSESLDREWDDIGDKALTAKAIADIDKLLALPSGSSGLSHVLDWVEKFLSGNHVLSLEAETRHHQHLHQTGKKKKTKVSKEQLATDMQLLHEEQAANELAWRVMQLVLGLFQFGFYYDVHRREVVARGLVRLLLTSRTAGSDLMTMSHAHETVMSAKSVICEILVKYLQVERNIIFSALLSSFHHEFTALEAQLALHPSAHLKPCAEEELRNIRCLGGPNE